MLSERIVKQNLKSWHPLYSEQEINTCYEEYKQIKEQEFIKQDDIKHSNDVTIEEATQDDYDLVQARHNLFMATTQDNYNERPQASKTIRNERAQQHYNDVLFNNNIRQMVI